MELTLTWLWLLTVPASSVMLGKLFNLSELQLLI